MRSMMRMCIGKMIIGAGLAVFLCLAVAGPDASAAEVTAPSEVLTFDAFCARVLDYYPRLKQQGATIELALARKFEAIAGFLPKVRGSASMTTSDDQVYVFGTLLRQRSFTQSDFELSRLNDPASRTNYDIGIHAEMPLFDSLQTIYRVRQATHAVAAARYDESFARMETILIASEAYLRAVAVGKVLAVAEEACASSETDIKQAQELKDKGVVLGADFYAARVISGDLKRIRSELIGRRKALNAFLNILMGEPPLRPLTLDDSLTGGPLPAKGLEEWLAEAYRARPDLLSIDEAIRAEEDNLARERARALPAISAFGDLKENTQDFNRGGGSFAVGIVGSIDIFDPGYFARVRVARESLKKLEHSRAIARDAVTRDLSDEYVRLQSITDDVPVFRGMMDDARQAVDLMAPLYREGRKSIGDLVGMRQALIRAHQGYYDTVTGTAISRERLLFLSGQLDGESARMILQGGGE